MSKISKDHAEELKKFFNFQKLYEEYRELNTAPSRTDNSDPADAELHFPGNGRFSNYPRSLPKRYRIRNPGRRQRP